MCNNNLHEHCGENNKNFSIRNTVIMFILLLAVMILPLYSYIKILIYMIIYLWSGFYVLVKAIKNFLYGDTFDETFLMSIATLGAAAIGEYPEAAMVMLLYNIGEFLQEKAVTKAENSISELMNLRTDYANIYQNLEIIKKSPQEVNIDDIIIVKTGEKIPLDGIIIDGKATADTSALSGESLPRIIKSDDTALSGWIITDGFVKIRVTKCFQDCTVSKILELVENADEKKAKAEKFITKFAKIYTPFVVFAALMLAVLPPLIFHAELLIWVKRALTFLVISCPCALVISIPLGFFAGIGCSSKSGILIKGGIYLETLAKAGMAVFDKTGTLTKGNFTVSKVISTSDWNTDEILKQAAIAESFSDHPIANAVKNAYNEVIQVNDIHNVCEFTGEGIKVNIGKDEIYAGSKKLMNRFEIPVNIENDTENIVYIAQNHKLKGYILIEDEIKENSASAIIELKKLGVRSCILSGDSFDIVDKAARQLKVEDFFASLLPADKVEKLEEIMKNNKNTVIFIGDGINDAPVLKRADAGIAMGAMGTDSAIDAADIVIMDDNPLKVASGISISRKTMQIVKQNIAFAISVKILFLVLGSIGFMTMWGAVFADVGVTLIAVLNSMRAMKTC